jgi:catechol 2,3-dioxygenase-like lactoylglutathione lyase family enzyme
MIHHVSIGVRDITIAKAFYDAALAPLGYLCLSADDASIGYGTKEASFWVSLIEKPVTTDKKPGLHFCFAAPTQDGVRAFHKAALSNGGYDNGTPGLRPDYGPNYFAAFVIDTDGYRLEAYCGK